MIIWFLHQIVSFSFCCEKLNITMFSHILYDFPKNWCEGHIHPLIPFSTTNNISTSIKRSNFAIKAACHAGPVAEKKFA